jgi:ubiquitin-activating enzyme E1
MKASNL